MAVRLIEPETAIQAISEALLKLGTLYQVPNFNEANALILAEWTAENYKHKTLALILDALRNPAIIYEDGNVARSWRLTPETVAIWVEKKAVDQEHQRQLKAATEARTGIESNMGSEMSEKTSELIKSYLKQLGEGMFKRSNAPKTTPELERIDLLLKLINQYRKENFDPITGKIKEDALDENEWLLSKGYVLENGELKEIK